MSAVDYLLTIKGIKGESKDASHKGAIHVESWSWGASNVGTMQKDGGGGGGRAKMRDFFFTTRLGSATPGLMRRLASGEHIPEAVLICRKAGKTPQEFLRIVLEDVIVSSYRVDSARGDGPTPTEVVGLNFASVSFQYREQKSDGTLGGKLVATHSLKQNSTS
ncbi:MAG TPA: type VI secretion system tube protein Hcp [Pyrinomonadaceae bacterium]|jgi:type VI secretion system secreted protein Hcp|nr:type VI secretion system tube protein Hcp [Pyrinomonadaceae bacterium]